MRFLRSHFGLIFVIVIFLAFTFWIGSYLGSANRPPKPGSNLAVPSSVSESPSQAEPGQPPPGSNLTWVAKELKQYNLTLEVPESWPTILEQETLGVRFVDPGNDRHILGVRVHPKNSETRVKAGLTIAKETPLVVAGQAATVLEAERKNQPGTLALMLIKNFGKLYEFYGQEADFDRFAKSANFISGDLSAVKSYRTTGCNVTVDYLESWHNREIFGPPGAATITGFDPKPIPESGESSGKIQVSCITGEAAARYRANFEAFHKEVKTEKIPLAQFEALKMTGRVPDDSPAAAGQLRLQVVLEREDAAPGGRTYIITYTSPKESFEADRKGLTTVLETIEFQ